MVNFLMVRRRACAVSNHEAAITHPSRRGEDAAPQDEAVTRGWRTGGTSSNPPHRTDMAEIVGWAKPPGRANARPMINSACPPFDATIWIDGGHGANAPLPTLHLTFMHLAIRVF